MNKTLKLLACLLCMMSFNLKGQENLKFTEVVSVENTTKDVLYTRALEWFSENFNSANAVIDLSDKENGTIIAKSNVSYNPSRFSLGGTASAVGTIDFVVKLFFKDGRFKYEITEFKHSPYRSDAKCFGYLTTDENPPFKSHIGSKKRAIFLWNDLKTKAENAGQAIVLSLTHKLSQVTESENNNW